MKATATPEEISKFELAAGDIIITKDSESWDDIAVPAYVPVKLPGVICAYHLCLIKPHLIEIDAEFLFRAFCSDSVANQFRVTANGVTRFGLSHGAIKKAFFPVPPKTEQKMIVDHINRMTIELAAAISRTEREIALIREYQTRLIVDVVTGKVDVRDVPVELITDSEIEELLPADDIEELEGVVDD